MTTPFGNYEDDDQAPEFDRDAETDTIVRNPVTSPGNPGATNLLDTLKKRFAQLDQRHTVYIQGRNKQGVDLWLEMDLDISEPELNDYKESAKVNRQARRGQGGKPSEERMFARLLTEKTVALFEGNPSEEGIPLKDSDGDPMDLKNDEWTAIVGQPGNPVMGAIALFGYPNLRNIAGRFMMEAGFGEDVEAVDPTSASSGV